MIKEPHKHLEQMMERLGLPWDEALLSFDHRLKICNWVINGKTEIRPSLITDTVIPFAKSVGIFTKTSETEDEKQNEVNATR